MSHQADEFGAEHSQDDPIDGEAPTGDATPGEYHSGDQAAGSSEETGTIYGADTDIEESNPSASGPRGLEGDLGISSERTGPDRAGNDRDTIQGTGSVGTATDRTDGTMDTERRHPEMPAEGPEMDEGQNEAQENWRDQTDERDHSQIDRTVGEANTAGTTSHKSDPKDNPGHSHG